MKRVEFEAKNLTEAQKYAVEHLKMPLDKIKITVLKEKRGILGIGSSGLYEAVINITPSLEGKKYLESILKELGVETKIELRTLNEGKEIYYRVESDQNALLIGREGKTLLALQMLLRNYLNTFTDDHLLISLDIGNYHDNRKRQLEILATKTAKEVAFSKIEVKLDPMNAFDRRIIHTKLSEWRDVTTESVGEGEERAIIIKPKK